MNKEAPYKSMLKIRKNKSGSKKQRTTGSKKQRTVGSKKQKKTGSKRCKINPSELPVGLMINFWNNIRKHMLDPIIKKYLIILGINPDHFNNSISNEYFVESKVLFKMFFRYPAVVSEIYKYCFTKKSKLEFLHIFSEEQFKYITNVNMVNTKLIACAGSGKTRSIIGRIKFLVEHNLVKKEEIYMITFSKHAAMDFRSKVKELFPNFMEFCQLKNFSTIDSLAKSILCKVKTHKSENVEILSIALRNYLTSMQDADTKIVSNIKCIKHLFIDEAQDLNEVQYDIAMLLQEKFGTIIELIGDPNQNIFQFRRSSSTYLLNFPATRFELTLNFRSTQQIIDFSDSIKPIHTSKSISATNKIGPNVIVLTKSAVDIHRIILNFIKMYGKQKDLSNIAIICPTRGIGAYGSVGLSVFFNLFKINNILFNQLYDESGLNDERKKNVGKIPGHINLITYHGTKGLEFDVVFVMDFYQHLFNIKPTHDEHNINQYLLYVASSRAISMMFICTYLNTHEGYINHWMTKVHPDNYHSDSALKIPHLSFREKDRGQALYGVTELITEMTDEQLNMVHDMLQIDEDDKLFTRRIYQDFTHIDRGKDETLFGIFCEELFYLQHYLSRNFIPRKLSLIQMIIDAKFVVIDNDVDYKLLKTHIMANKLTWEKYDIAKNDFSEHIRMLIEKNFSRDNELDNCIICTNEFIKIIGMNIEDIKKSYDMYLNPPLYHDSYKEILIDFFYLIVVQYAYDINHYYYISNHGQEKHYLLQNGSELFEAMNNYVSTNNLAYDLELKVNVYYPCLGICGEIDFIEKCHNQALDKNHNFEIETIVEIKCVKDISIRYYIQLMLYNFCYYFQKIKKNISNANQKNISSVNQNNLYCNKFKILNLLTGLEHYIIIKISPTNMFNLLIILSDVGNLNFNNLNLVYDLETNNSITTIGPLTDKPNLSRCYPYRQNNKWYGKIYPEITEIAIRDYETGMILLDTLVKPNIPPNQVVQKITGIKPSMLIDKPKIDVIRTILKRKMKNFINCKMMAHNGHRFDDGIILYDDLVDKQNISFLDTLSIIPIHLPEQIKLEKKSLGIIYKTLFGTTFPAHRAMSDVDALIKIMRYLKIQF